jgi:capsular exopolysaccharide synthesis family protein
MVAEERSGAFDLRDQLAVLKHRKWVVILVALLAVVAATGISLVERPVYQSVGEVLVSPDQQNPLSDTPSNQVPDPERTIRSDVAVLKSDQIRTEVRRQLGSAPGISIQSDPTSNIIKLAARGPSGRRAAEVANAYMKAFGDLRRQEAAKTFTDAAKQLQPKIDDLQSQIDAVATQIDKLPAPLQATGGQGLKARRDALIAQQVQLQQKQSELQVASTLQDGGTKVLTVAPVTSSPVSPRPVRNAVLGLLLGAIAGVTLAFVFEFLGGSIRSKKDLPRQGSMVLAEIPLFAPWAKDDEAELVSQTQPHSPAAEAYRGLRTSLQSISAIDEPQRLVQVTSASRAEGKSTTLANLGVVMARGHQRVVIVCCDLRRPRLYKFFGMSNRIGLTSVLAGKSPLSAAIQSVPDVPGLSLLASGPIPGNPSEVLSSPRTQGLLRALQNDFDVVLLDSPPLLPVTDAAVMSRWVDGVVVVAAVGSTKRRELDQALELLDRVQAPLVGMVLNGVAPNESYYYRYTEDDEDRTSPARSDERAPTNGSDARRDRTRAERGSSPRPRSRAGPTRRG